MVKVYQCDKCMEIIKGNRVHLWYLGDAEVTYPVHLCQKCYKEIETILELEKWEKHASPLVN